MVETWLAFLVATAGGLFPVVSVEVYLIGASTLLDGSHLVAMAVAAGVGQTLGKLPYYFLGRGALRLPWLQRQAQRSNGKGRWSARVAEWRETAEHRPLWMAWTMLVSAFISVPPFMVMCVLAGTVRMSLVAFVAVSLVGRVARFALVVFAPGAALAVFGWLPG